MNWLALRFYHGSLLLGLMLFVLAGPASTINAENNQQVHTIYHVYIDGTHVGHLLDEEQYFTFIEKKLEKYEQEYPHLSLQIAEQVEIIPEFVFHQRNEDEGVLAALDELSVQAEAVALMVNEEAAVYLPSEEKAEQTVKKLITQYVSEDEYNAYLEAELADESQLEVEVGQQQLMDVSLTENIVEEMTMAHPEDVLSVESALKKLNKGVLEEQPYTVKEGDVLGSIASDHNLSTSELLALNGSLTEDSVIQIGQELQVTVYQPLVEVLTTKVQKTEEEIPFQTEVKEDDSMWKGEQKVTQEGRAGLQVIDYKLTEKNGQLIKREVLSEEVKAEPVTKIVVKGTKEMPSRGSGQLGWPAVGGYISSYQGNRWGRFHRGIDIARPSNYNILAADNGTVTFASQQGGYGNLIKINHNNGMETLYAHLRSIDVQVGQTVTKGQKIGVMGSTGNSTGIHLHFEVTQNGQLQNPMDYLK